ncbi:aminotransferase class I/II-fold pyridoxal phosphate-dependent enzyme [Nocardioides sp. CER19]|uniref:MalY/PatB family protein n=1 Tax=Nocardioides sp. CER19 TaxID=3038538 RepID=UPI00244858C0|nr:aminotransferase class I/II-fold pyridoxal phosphate-dependent enzyme [Nocardioides sp. CER19]MDH2415647.1 aminotransferase class I/II-fold pyridoxal phosphate-dependent enzyme [Nocardioides sp. CER19]
MSTAVTSAEPLDVLRRRTSEKWTTHPPDVLPMFVAEMDFPLAPAIKAVLLEAIERGDTGYVNPQLPAVRESFADFAGERWGWVPDVDRMRTTTDVSVVIVETLRRLAAPGDGVIITPPTYPPFFDLIPEADGVVVEVPLADDGASYALDLDGIDRALADGARGVLLCNPHNPLGLVHSRETLTELSRIVARHDGFVLSDEIHAPLTHAGHEFTPYLTVSEDAREHGIAAHSASKAFNLAGLKCAFFVAGSEPMAAIVDALPAEVSVRTGLLGAMATEAGFSEARDWLAGTLATVEQNLDLLEELLERDLPTVRLRRPQASYLAWLDMSGLGWGDDPAQRALDDARVALSSGLMFGAEGAGHARMNVGCAPETIVEAVARLARAAASVS